MLSIKSSVLIHIKYTPSVPQLHMANIADAQLNRTRIWLQCKLYLYFFLSHTVNMVPTAPQINVDIQ